jgi:hypothetical protein
MITAVNYKAAIWRRVQRRRNAWEQKFAVLFRNILNNQYKELADRITADNVRSNSLLNVIQIEPVEKVITDLYKVVGADFAQRGTKALKDDSDWYGIMTNYVKRRLWKRIEAINKTTIENAGRIINRNLEESIEEGLGAEATATKVRKGLLSEGIELNQWRSLRIARTEIMSASNIGTLEGAKASGEDLEKYWIATYDERTRDTHRTVEEQNPKAFDEGFRVGAYLMECPGDPDAGPEETINCRCTIVFKPRGYDSEEFYRNL